MAQYDQVTTAGTESVLATNKVLRNTYMLLSMTLVFSAVTALISMALNLSQMVGFVMTLGAIGIVWFVLPRTYEKTSGIGWTFAFAGLMGAGLGPILNAYMAMGPGIVVQALAGTAIVTFSLSFYALTTKKDFSFMGGFLMVGLVLLIVASIASFFIPGMSVAISAGAVLIFSLMILFDTSRIINGGETNYIRATVSLYLDIYNLFVHLLHLVAVLTGDD